MSNTVKTLRKEIQRARGVKPGTVVRFNRSIDAAWAASRGIPSTITYAAIFVGGLWYYTGRGNLGARAHTNREFLDLMASGEIFGVEVATVFERVEREQKEER